MTDLLKRILIAACILIAALLITRKLPGRSAPDAVASNTEQIGQVGSIAQIAPSSITGQPETASPHAPQAYTPAVAPLDVADLQILQRLNEEVATLTARVVPSVVSINTRKKLNIPRTYLSPFGAIRRYEQEERPAGLGSGVFVSAEGHIITNNHVIDGVTGIEIITSAGDSYPAKLIGTDPDLDIAILQVETDGEETFPALPFADSDQVRVGESVIAVGNPFGLSETVTRGIISARDRQLSDSSHEWFQTDTVINPGNSGGPLINVRGEIVGINVSIYAGQSDVRVWQGVGFAIPANDVRVTFDAIMERGRPVYGYLGVGIDESDNGIFIANVRPGSPAEQAGLRRGDRVITFGGRKAGTGADLVRRVGRSRIGQAVELEVERDGQQVDLQATIGERPTEVAADGENGDVRTEATLWGVLLRDFSDAERRRLGMAPDTPGIIVTGIDGRSPLRNVLRPNDIIFQLNQMPISSVAMLAEESQNLPDDRQSALYIARNGKRVTVRLVP